MQLVRQGALKCVCEKNKGIAEYVCSLFCLFWVAEILCIQPHAIILG